MSPNTYLRILGLADAYGVRLDARCVPARKLPYWRMTGEAHPDAGYCPDDRHIKLAYADETDDDTIEVVMLHELGHAATLNVTPERIQEHAHEMRLGYVSEQTKREEVWAWEWAAERMDDRLRPLAARLCATALRTYAVDPAESRRVADLIRRSRG